MCIRIFQPVPHIGYGEGLEGAVPGDRVVPCTWPAVEGKYVGDVVDRGKSAI